MNQASSADQLTASHNQDVQVSLDTPAHQGVSQNSDRLSEGIYQS